MVLARRRHDEIEEKMLKRALAMSLEEEEPCFEIGFIIKKLIMIDIHQVLQMRF